jgi:serine/threonine protein kinase
MVSGKSYNGFMTDVWSMGIILYVMVCGSLPFEDKTTRELYKKIISGDYTLPEYLSDDVKRALQSMLITDPKKRIPLSHIRYLPFFTKYT